MQPELIEATHLLPHDRPPTFGEFQDVAHILNGPPEIHRRELGSVLDNLEASSHVFDLAAQQELSVFNGDSVHIRNADPGRIFVRAYAQYLAHALRLWGDLDEDPESARNFVRMLSAKIQKRDDRYLEGEASSADIEPTLGGLFANVAAFDAQAHKSLDSVLLKLREEIAELHEALGNLPLELQQLRVPLRRRPPIQAWLSSRSPAETARLEKKDPIIGVLGEIGDITIIGASLARLFGPSAEIHLRNALREIELQVQKKNHEKGTLMSPQPNFGALSVTA